MTDDLMLAQHDAAVEEAVEYTAGYVYPKHLRVGSRLTALGRLIAAAEARGAARERARECKWVRPMPDSDPELWTTGCGEDLIWTAPVTIDVPRHCTECGGRVTIVEAK